MASKNDIFSQAALQWDLETLYTDLSSAKGKRLTPVEKRHLRGLLCGYSPAEIAQKLHKSIKGVEVDLCNTLYIYVKNLVGQSNGKVENWRNITEWLEEAGYKTESFSEYEVSDCLSLDIVVKRANVSIKKNQLLIDVNIRVATPLPSELVIREDLDQNGKA